MDPLVVVEAQVALQGGLELAQPREVAAAELDAPVVVEDNTSGLFNAVIVDRPCLTVLAPRYRETQAEAVHFHHLLEADVLETCASTAELADRLERIGEGEDVKAAQRRRFVEGWIRPRGIKRPAGEWVARAIELLERGRDAVSIKAMLDGPRPLAEAEPHAS